MPPIRLRSSDGQIFDTDEEVVKCSGTIKAMLECTMNEDENDVIPLPNVKSAILNKILQWANFHKDDAPSENDKNKVAGLKYISMWDADFLKVDQVMLFELIMAANYLDIKGLLELTTNAVVDMIKGKTPEEIRKSFNVKNYVNAMEH